MEEKIEEKFKSVAANEENPKWNNMISRQEPLYQRRSDIRSDFQRDCNRILHSNSFRRLKHKTQVFFSPSSDHICTRIEHVNLVESISYTIANALGLNTELTKAISLAHDMGHSPFGHQGEKILSSISKKEIDDTFWHEKNGLFLADRIELLEDAEDCKRNLDLTYAVRDGIISHCGEIDENSLKPRQEAIDLDQYMSPNQYNPYTWEGCIVKIADKISYIGRDIEDALSIGLFQKEKINELKEILHRSKKESLNNTVIVNDLIMDLCYHSNIQDGFVLSKEKYEMLNAIKKFNYENIYLSERLKPSHEYFKLIIEQIYHTLCLGYGRENTKETLFKLSKVYPNLAIRFLEWLEAYWNLERKENYQNRVVFDMSKEEDYKKAVLTYISGMTDEYAITLYDEIISF